jgi:hypothetical protein
VDLTRTPSAGCSGWRWKSAGVGVHGGSCDGPA